MLEMMLNDALQAFIDIIFCDKDRFILFYLAIWQEDARI